MTDERLSLLISWYVDGQLPELEKTELEELLRQSAAAREQFWRETRLHTDLHETEHAAAQANNAPRRTLGTQFRRSETPRWWRRPTFAFLAISALVSISLTAGLSWRSDPESPLAEATTAAVAFLAQSVDAQWESPSDSHAVGTALEPGWLRLRSGLIEVEFYSGARVVLEGPAKLRLDSTLDAYCAAGRLRADVPPQARGFTILTPAVHVVDLGTAFGVEVRGSESEVHVIEGKVRLEGMDSPPRYLQEPEALIVAGNGRISAMPAQPTWFVQAGELEQRSIQAQGDQFSRWRETGHRWNIDPAAFLRFDFESLVHTSRTLVNVTAGADGKADGTVVGCGVAEGRWLGKRALEFRRMSDRVRVNIEEEFSCITLAAWVRVDALDRAFNSLFMSEGYDTGALHWQITNKGVLLFGTQGPNNAGYDYRSPVIFTPERIGKWVHLALVFDSESHRVAHYVDGLLVSQERTTFELPFRIGAADLGNWSVGTRNTIYPVRHFSGLIDEFAVFTRPLRDKEILEAYETGRIRASPTYTATDLRRRN